MEAASDARCVATPDSPHVAHAEAPAPLLTTQILYCALCAWAINGCAVSNAGGNASTAPSDNNSTRMLHIIQRGGVFYKDRSGKVLCFCSI